MHQAVKDNLEEYLRRVGGRFASRTSAGKLGPAIPAAMEEHLNACPECAREVNALQEQAMALRALRPPAGLEPRPGFYARVIQRIEETRVVNTVWAAFLDPIFARRIVYGCATLVVILGTYMISTESGNRTVAPLSAPAITATATQAAAVRDDNYATPQERDAVLVTLAAYHE